MSGLTRFLPYADDVLLMFPAFLIGAAFGTMLGLGLMGRDGSTKQAWRTLRLGMIGSGAGVVIVILTYRWLPPIIGPFMICPLASMLTTAFTAIRPARH